MTRSNGIKIKSLLKNTPRGTVLTTSCLKEQPIGLSVSLMGPTNSLVSLATAAIALTRARRGKNWLTIAWPLSLPTNKLQSTKYTIIFSSRPSPMAELLAPNELDIRDAYKRESFLACLT